MRDKMCSKANEAVLKHIDGLVQYLEEQDVTTLYDKMFSINFQSQKKLCLQKKTKTCYGFFV